MNTLQRVCTIIIASFALAACTPLGYVFDEDSSYNANAHYDDFWTVSRRQTYNLGDSFNRNSDLWVFASSQGIVESVPSTYVDISLVTNPDSANPTRIDILGNNSSDNTYRLSSNVGTGRKLVVVSYGGNTAEYSIEVADPLGLDPGNGGNGGGSGIGIIWH